ncbi:MAG: nitrate reductase cytochrome c-type subunit [Dongiaceae bacterium]
MSWASRLGFVAAAVSLAVAAALAEEPYSALRGDTPLTEEGPAPRMMPERNTDLREVRNYPEQPPVIPHETDGYVIDARSNKCLSCHARARTGESQAPMISITHFMDRDGQFLAAVSPRRYFCTQCHVSQLDVTPPVENDFVDIDSLMRASQSGQ